MSLICKLDPTVRRARFARRELLKFLRAQMHNVRSYPASDARLKLESWLVTAEIYVDMLIRCPWRSGATKNRLIARVSREYATMVQGLQS